MVARCGIGKSLYNQTMAELDQDLPGDPELGTENGMEIVETPVDPDAEGLRHVRIDVRRALPDRRLDRYVTGRLGKMFSRTAIQRYIREGMVTVGGNVVKPSYIIRTADVIDMLLPVTGPREILPEPIPLNIVYEDRDMLALNKQAGLVVHPARGNWTGTLVNALAYYFNKNWRGASVSWDGGEREQPHVELPSSGGVFRPGIVHRLDRDTTGIMLIAKTQLALWRLGKQFELRKTSKVYNAIVHGSVERDEDIIDLPIGRHPKVRELRAVYRGQKPFPDTAKEAITRYKVLERIGPVGCGSAAFTLVELRLMTGRTHQLRVHMSFMGHPMVGDALYGGGPIYRSQLLGRPDRAEGPIITRQALHARSIAFRHPRTGESMTVEAPLADDFVGALEELQSLERKL